jgi:hypothetical protein
MRSSIAPEQGVRLLHTLGLGYVMSSAIELGVVIAVRC